MNRTLLAVLLALLLPLSAQAGAKLINMPPAPGAVFPTPTLESPTISGPVTLNETLATDLAAQTCAGWGLTTPVGAWSCTDSPLTITRTASASDLTLTYSGTQTVVPGTVYEIVATYTITAGTFASTIGGRVGATYSSTTTAHEYFPAGTNGKHIITAVAASAGVLTGISVNAITNTISASEGPVVTTAALTSAGNQSGTVDIVTGTKSAGIMSVHDFVDAGSGGTRYAWRSFNAETQTGSLTSGGTFAVSGAISTSSTIVSSRTAATSGAISHTGGTFAVGANSADFRAGMTLGTMNGDDEFNGFLYNPTNGNHTGSNNYVKAFNAASLTGDAEASEYALAVGTGYDAPVALAEATANGSVATAMSNVGPTGAQTAIQGWMRVDVAGTPRYVPFW